VKKQQFSEQLDNVDDILINFSLFAIYCGSLNSTPEERRYTLWVHDENNHYFNFRIRHGLRPECVGIFYFMLTMQDL